MKTNDMIVRQAFDLMRKRNKGVHEVRLLNAAFEKERFIQTITGYFDNADSLIEALQQVQSAQGVYITLNPVVDGLLARANNRLVAAKDRPLTRDHEVARLQWLPIDIDPVRPAGISSSDHEHGGATRLMDEVVAYLKTSLGWSSPVIADSGNGAHALFPIDLPITEAPKIAAVLKELDKKFSTSAAKIDTTVFNPARIWKLYGTMACKGDSIPSRPHRMSRILEIPDDLS